MIRISQLKLDVNHDEKQLVSKICKQLHINETMLQSYQIQKMSIDARKKPQIFYIYVVDVEVNNEKQVLAKIKDVTIQKVVKEPYVFSCAGDKKLANKPVIIGSGPAGLFCAYMLSKYGYCPILLEQGEDVETRSESVENFWSGGTLKKHSNVQFGEGGAGTFSDGKLNTLVKDKYGRNKKVLEVFVENGAPQNILYEAKPHIGTDILKNVVKNMRNRIIEWGGTVLFESCVTDICFENNKVKSVVVNEKNLILTDCLVLAIGHSARDTFEMLHKKGVSMEAKDFAVGFRVEHPQNLINQEMYGKQMANKMPPAPYKVTAKTSFGRGVYSFCMCPGGYVVNASSEENRLAINGMSYSKRDSSSANSAIIISVTPEDFASEDPLAGIAFQKELEEKAFLLGESNIPYTTYGELCALLGYKGSSNTLDTELFNFFERNTKGNVKKADLSCFFKKDMMESFMEGMEHFDKIIPGFAHPDTKIYAVESRTSSPVRIVRDNETLESNFSGLYPCGEGAGYAGGITSAGMDGIKVAEKIAAIYKPLKE